MASLSSFLKTGGDAAEEDSSASEPHCINWSVEKVSEWIESLGFKEYKECILSNAVSGSKLIWVDASTLPRMGITNWKDIQFISCKVRELLAVEEPYWNKSITLPYRCEMGMFLEKKSFTGRRSQKLKFTARTS